MTESLSSSVLTEGVWNRKKVQKLEKVTRKWLEKLMDCWYNGAERTTACDPSVVAHKVSETVSFHHHCAPLSNTDGFILLNGGMLEGVAPCEIRQLLLDHEVAPPLPEGNQSPTPMIRYSSSLSFMLVERPLQKNENVEERVVDIEKVKATRETHPNPAMKPKTAARKLPFLSMSSFTTNTASVQCSVFLLRIPERMRAAHQNTNSNSIGEYLILLPCVCSKVVQQVGDRFRPSVIHAPLSQTSSPWPVQPSPPHGPRTTFSIQVEEVPGLYLIPNFLSKQEHDSIWREMNASQSLQHLQTRRVAHFNRRFIYGVNQVGKEGDEVNPNPSYFPWMQLRLHNKDRQVHICGPLPDFGDRVCDQLTANFYDYRTTEGDKSSGIAPHVDAHTPFGNEIFVVSLGSYTIIEYRRWDRLRTESKAVPVFVPPCSLVIMSGECRYAWEHAIAEKRVDVINDTTPLFQRGNRISLTWRVARDATHLKSTCPYPALCDGV